MSTTIGPYLPSHVNAAQNAYAGASATTGRARAADDEAPAASTESPAATVTLSEDAQAYVAASEETGEADIPLAERAAAVRAWFDEQYESLGIESVLLEGEVAVDLTVLDRAALSAVASNAEALFSEDEVAAAEGALGARFDDALAPHVVIARHTGNYARLYQAASDYLDKAGADEQATEAWQAQKAAVEKGLAAATASFGKAPDTGDANDPVHELLGRKTASGSPLPDSSTASVAARARALLDDQINAARDDGANLEFRRSRRAERHVDFAEFDNRTLATVVLNPDSAFSPAEVFAAKTELDDRARQTMLGAVTSGDSYGSGSLGLLQAYSKMSDEEKEALGITESVTQRVIQNYDSMMSLQNALGGSSLFPEGGAAAGLSAYL